MVRRMLVWREDPQEMVTSWARALQQDLPSTLEIRHGGYGVPQIAFDLHPFLAQLLNEGV